MHKPVSEIMTPNVDAVGTQDTVETVELFMASHHRTSVAVCAPDGDLFGVISLADIERLRAKKANPKALRAWEACTYKPVAVPPDTPAEDVAQIMLKRRIHHVFVTKDGVSMGIVSALDLLREYLASAREAR